MKSLALAQRPVLGSWINTGSTVVAELMAAAGFDFLVVDAEHSSVDVPQAQAIFQAIVAGNRHCAPLVRLAGHRYDETKRYLDAGAHGVIAPLVNTPDEALEILRAVKYPPEGERGVGFGRSHGYGFDFDAYMEEANGNTFVCVQIEHVQALNNLDAILSLPGIDAAFIGPYDLTASMGITACFDHPDYLAVRRQIVEACQRHEVIPGIHVVPPDPEQVQSVLNEGFELIGYSLDITMLGNACREGISAIR